MYSLNIAFAIAALAAGSLCLVAAVLPRDLMMLQQNSYRNDRYVRWFEEAAESTNLGRIFACIGLFFMLIPRLPFFVGGAISTVVALCWGISLLRRSRRYKKPLVWTARARRIYAVMFVLAAVAIAVPSALCGVGVGACVVMGSVVVSPLYLLGANALLQPVEKAIADRYRRDARRILASMPDLKVIGVTGSYGKTSTKHYLQRILSEKFSTCMTPGSFNTPMGVIRTVREYLKPYDEVFIVEMGAKQPGDIAEICDIVQPTMGIITAVGEQHLESFKTLENVQRTKFELADALPSDGLVVVNDDFRHAAMRPVTNTRCLRYALDRTANADYRATSIVYSPSGTDFTVVGPGLDEQGLRLHTPLVGSCNVSNLLAAVIVALRLGVSTQAIARAAGQMEQVEHRLNLRRTPGGVAIIDDAFNSNPSGALMALDVLAMMKPKEGEGRRILVTPGMVELGERQEQANEEFGRQAATRCDVAVVVGRYNREAILEGLERGRKEAAAQGREAVAEDDIYPVGSFAEAQGLLARLGLRSGDTVLYENDLPDTFR